MRTVESVWLHHMAYKLWLRVVFPSKKNFVDKILLALVEKTLVTYV